MESTVATPPTPDDQALSMPAPLWRVVVFGGIALAAGLGLAKLATRTHTQTYTGTLSARVIPVTAEQSGVIAEIHVTEGEQLAIGQPIVSLTDSSVDDERADLDRQITRLRDELDRMLARADLELEWRLKEVKETIFTARLQSAEYLEEKHLHEMEKVALTDVLSMNSTAFSTPSDSVFDSVVLKAAERPASRLNTVLRLEAATNASEVCGAQVELCDEQIDWLEELQDSLPDRVKKSVGVDVAERNLEAAIEEREALEEASATVEVTSPAIGQAGVFFKRVGDYVSLGDPLVEVLDDSQRYVTIDVPSGEVSEFTVGTELNLIFPGDVLRKGRVVRIAPQAVQKQIDGQSRQVIPVYVEQARHVWPTLPVGTRVEAGI